MYLSRIKLQSHRVEFFINRKYIYIVKVKQIDVDIYIITCVQSRAGLGGGTCPPAPFA